MRILVVDVGGTSVKILASGQQTVRKFRSGLELTAEQMVTAVVNAAKGWKYDAVSIGYPVLSVAAWCWQNRNIWELVG